MIELPENLQPYRDAIEATRLPIIAAAFDDAPPSGPHTSRLGGMPWWPKSRPWPLDTKGKPLLLLVQVNFAETPPLDPFPRRGMLQLFIGTDDLYGCDVGRLSAPSGFLAVYHPDGDDDTLGEHPLTSIGHGLHSPLEKPLEARALRFTQSEMLIDATDYRFGKLLPEIAAVDELSDAYSQAMQGKVPAIRLGGYPTFTQTDPREYLGHSGIGDFTLLTVDTTDGIMWGDVGVAQFFMQRADLVARDFAKVVYNWDCS